MVHLNRVRLNRDMADVFSDAVLASVVDPKLQPMLGCVGVAPPAKQAFRSGNLGPYGPYGGNMDYNQHAAQGDGELTGNALETSTDIDFTVDLIPGKSLGQPRFENGEYVTISGIAGSFSDALRMATTGMSRWLADEYKLSTGEIAMVLATSMRYDIAEVVDPQVHLVAKVSKAALAQIPKP